MEWNGIEWNEMEWNRMEWNEMESNGIGREPYESAEWNRRNRIFLCG